MKLKGFKSFFLKVYETKGFADAFLRKCVNLKSLADILPSIKTFEPSAVSLAALLSRPFTRRRRVQGKGEST